MVTINKLIAPPSNAQSVQLCWLNLVPTAKNFQVYPFCFEGSFLFLISTKVK